MYKSNISKTDKGYLLVIHRMYNTDDGTLKGYIIHQSTHASILAAEVKETKMLEELNG